ncbi:hypothetical protein L7F22_027641 [Adiantum nelumboides]|nr:hypothetical protein [Adiantum nelumboides]
MGICEDLPNALFSEIFQFLPASQVAGACSLVCRLWRDLADDAPIWRDMCKEAGLSETDCLRCLFGWKGLFGLVFGQNMVASPCFESVPHMEMEAMKHQRLGAWEPKHRILLNRISSLDDDHEDSHTYSFWAVEGGTVFQRGGGDGVVRECPPVGCPPCPAFPDRPVIATSFEWGKVQQCISFPTFSEMFLDSSPPLLVSLWYAGRRDAESQIKLQVLFRDKFKHCISFWDSGEILAKAGEWQELKAIVRGYPAGIQSIILKVGGMSLSSHKMAHGFFGAKFTGLKLKFLPPFEVRHFDESTVEHGKATLCSPKKCTLPFD